MKSHIVMAVMAGAMVLILGCLFTYVAMPSSEPAIQQTVSFTRYNEDGGELYRIGTSVGGRKNVKSFLQWVDVNYKVKKDDIEKVKASHMKEAEIELAKLQQIQTKGGE